MASSSRIGLPPYWGWLEGHSFWVTLVICLAITPGMMIVIAPVLESRWLPLRSSKQFVSFFPGDVFLGLMTTGLLILAQDLPLEERWYSSDQWRGIIQAVVLVAAVVLTYGEKGAYPRRALYSPTKIYHNGILYVGYGYLVITTLAAVLAGSIWTWSFAGWLSLCLLPGLIWLRLLLKDNSLHPEQTRRKAASAHVADWKPIWSSK
jgi:hypothetical protein